MYETRQHKQAQSRVIEKNISLHQSLPFGTVKTVQMYPDFGIIGALGNEHNRNIFINTNTMDNNNVRDGAYRTDDVPSVFVFSQLYNKLNNIELYVKELHPNVLNAFLNATNIDFIHVYVDEVKVLAKGYKEGFRNFDDNILQILQPGEYEAILEREYILEIYKYINYMLDIDTACSVFLVQNNIMRDEAEEIGTDIWREKWLNSIEKSNIILLQEWSIFENPIRNFIRAHYNLPLDAIIPLNLSYIGSTATGYKGPPKQRIQFDPEHFDIDADLDASLLADYAIHTDNIQPDRNRIFARRTTIDPLINFCAVVDNRLKNEVNGIDLYDTFDVAIKADDTRATAFGSNLQELLYNIRRNNPQGYSNVVNGMFQ